MTREEIVKWTKKLSVHIKEIDEQHKHLLYLINKANEDFKKGNREDLNELLNSLIEYTRVHFSTEESYFDNWDYPFAREHLGEHAKLILRTLEYKDRFDEGEDIAADLLVFLKGWWENHLKTYDPKYSEYFIKGGYVK